MAEILDLDISNESFRVTHTASDFELNQLATPLSALFQVKIRRMKLVIQRVSRACVRVEGEVRGEISKVIIF